MPLETMEVEIQILSTLIDGHVGLEFFAVLRGRVIGHTKLELPHGVLVGLYVEEGYRREGIARALVTAALLEVSAPLHVYYLPDGPGQYLFEAMGFKATGARGVEGSDLDYIWASHPGLNTGEIANAA